MKRRPSRHEPTTKKLHIVIPEDIHKLVRVRCAFEERSIQDYVASLIRDDVQRYTRERDLVLPVDLPRRTRRKKDWKQ